jgi:type I restriction enzyme S subunit
MTGTGGLKRVSPDYVKNLIIPYPSQDEQQEIVNYLDIKCADIDKLINLKQDKIERLNEYKKSLIYEYVTGKKEVPSA